MQVQGTAFLPIAATLVGLLSTPTASPTAGPRPLSKELLGPPPSMMPNVTWTRTTDPFAGLPAVGEYSLAIGADGTVYVGRNYGLAMSVNKGSTWSIINKGWNAPSLICTALCFNSLGEVIAAGGDVGSGSPQIFRHTGGNWVKSILVGTTKGKWTGLTRAPNGSIFACDVNEDVFRSTDNGTTFTKVGANIGNGSGMLWTIRAAPNGEIWTGGEMHSGVFHSKDNGTSWLLDGRLSNTAGYANNLLDIGFTKAGETIAGRNFSGKGVEVLRNGSWSVAAAGMDLYKYTFTFCTNLVSGAVYAGTGDTSGNGKIWQSLDNLATWQQITSGYSMKTCLLLALHPDGTLFCVDGLGQVWSTGPGGVPPPTVTLKSITVVPSGLFLLKGGKLQFSASGTGSDGKPYPLGTVTWSCSGGTISLGGLFTAPLILGIYRITATSGGVQGSTTVTVVND